VKILLTNPAGYEGLKYVSFPVEVEARGSRTSGMLEVDFSVMQSLPGFYYDEGDANEGQSYAFFRAEIKVIE